MRKLSLMLMAMVCSVALSAQTTILDHESAPTTTSFSYFGNCFLDGASTAVIANPDPTGANTTANVGEFVRTNCALTFAGAFANPLTPVVDLTTDNIVRMKVWMDKVGTFTLKLEGGSGGAPNWEQTLNVTTPNTWVDLTFDASLPSSAAPFQVGTGVSYTTVVIFPDLGAPATGVDQFTYFDEMVVDFATPAPDPVVTFQVDMNDYVGSFTDVNVFGTFNGFDPVLDPMTDPDGDGIYTADVTMPAGNIEYLFLVDGVAEVFNGTEGCIPFDGSGFFNRTLTVTSDLTTDLVCYNSCYACDADLVTITVDLGLNGATASPDGIYLAGGGNFDAPGGPYELTDGDGDMIYSISFQRPRGFFSYYTFGNGACPDYSCKEDIAGQPCADPANFNDRQMGPIMSDTTIATCFGICAIDAMCTPEPCSSATPPVGLASTVTPANVTLAWQSVWQSLGCQVNGGPVGSGSGSLNVLGFEANNTVIPSGALSPATTYVWQVRCTCLLPPAGVDATAFSMTDTFTTAGPRMAQENINLMSVSPNPATDFIQLAITAEKDAMETFQIIDMTGSVVAVWNAQTITGLNTVQMDVADLENGIYMVRKLGDDIAESHKFYIAR